MNSIDVTMVRIYITESSHLLNEIIHYLETEIKIRGASVFRAISGFGETGEKKATLLALSLDLPLCIEFFDDNEENIEKALNHLREKLEPKHIVCWKAQAL